MSYNPLPQSLYSECKKAAHVLREFTMPGAKTGPDKLIPKSLLSSAKGLAIITVVRVGFLFTVRGGSGLIVARLPEGGWSAPTLIGLGGLGGGFEFGGEITNFVIVLNSKQAINALAMNGQVSLGGSMSVAAGPLGRNIEADVALRKPAAFYTYSRTRGLFIGITIEGSVIVERKGANKKVYGKDVRAKQLLTGQYDQPNEAAVLYSALEEMTGGKTMEAAHAAHDFLDPKRGAPRRPTLTGMKRKLTGSNSGNSGNSGEAAGSSAPKSSSRSGGSSWRDKIPSKMPNVPNMSSMRSGKKPSSDQDYGNDLPAEVAPSSFGMQQSKGPPRNRYARKLAAASSTSSDTSAATTVLRHPRKISTASSELWDDELKGRALYDFQGTMDCDLSFKKNAQITVLTRTESQDDWWEGQIFDRIGIFPANYIEIL